MRRFLENILPDDDETRKWVSIGITIIIAGLLAIWGIYGIGKYGIALFLFTPLFIGAAPTILYGLKKDISLKQAWKIGVLTLSIFTLVLIMCAIEGVICIVMAIPIALLLTWIGCAIGWGIVDNSPDNGPSALLLLAFIIPALGFVEKGDNYRLTSVVTSIDINASLQDVWKNVVAFPMLDEPTEFIFKTGIAYPIDATIEGIGVGAIRHCNFTTGSFVEPITVWDEPNLLRFDVKDQPAPMKEISFWDIDAPHLHDYFVSTQGQFKLIALADGKTRLEGTTWYYHKIQPAFYWRLWSNYIIHKIHERVLKHIKVNSEKR